jgi:hypothetical protein
MPQGAESTTGAPVKEAYARKRVDVKRGGSGVGQGFSAMQNPRFKAALGGMILDIEAIAAAKLLRSGASVKMADIKRVGQTEVRSAAKKRARPNAVSNVLGRGRNLKGLRGDYSAEELAELDPELKVIVDHRRATAGAGAAGGGGGGAGGGGGGGGAAGGAGGGGGSGGGGGARAAGVPGVRARGEGKSAHTRRTAGGASLTLPVGSASAPSAAGGVFASDAEVRATFGDDFA